MNTMNLQGERLELFNQIASLDNESFNKVKKYIRRIVQTKSKVVKRHELSEEAIEEWNEIMRPLSIEEKIERLTVSEADPVYYTQAEMRQLVASWGKED